MIAERAERLAAAGRVEPFVVSVFPRWWRYEASECKSSY